MKVGIYFPSTEVDPRPDVVREFTRAVDAMGYDYVVTADHVLGGPQDREPAMWGPYDERDAFFDPFVLFAYMAALSDRLEFATSVLVLPQRPTALVAKQVADLAVLSGDRFRLSVGVGWNYVEFAALGQDFARRGARMDGQVELLRRLWAEDLVTASVGAEVIDRAGLNPRPSRPVPLWLGGYSEPALRRGARLGDGFSFGGLIDNVAPAQRRLHDLLREHGRDPSEFGTELVMTAAPGDEPGRWPRNRPNFLGGLMDTVDQWSALGGTHVAVTTYWMSLGPLREHLSFAERALELIRGS